MYLPLCASLDNILIMIDTFYCIVFLFYHYLYCDKVIQIWIKKQLLAY